MDAGTRTSDIDFVRQPLRPFRPLGKLTTLNVKVPLICVCVYPTTLRPCGCMRTNFFVQKVQLQPESRDENKLWRTNAFQTERGESGAKEDGKKFSPVNAR